MANAIEVADLCAALHVLPGPGGLLDQDPYWIERIKLVMMHRNQKLAEEQKRAYKR